MIENVGDLGLDDAAAAREIVRALLLQLRGEDMLEDLRAQRAQQLVLRAEVRVEGAAPDVGLVDDLLHRDIGIALSLQQAGKGVEYRLSGLFLSAIHGSPSRTFFRICPVTDDPGKLLLPFSGAKQYNQK